MSRLLFIRSYLLIVLLILLVGMGLDKIIASYTSQETVLTEKLLLRGSFQYIETLLREDLQNIPAVWGQSQATLQSTLGYPVAFYQLSDFSSQEQLVSSLRSGQTMAMATENDALVYYRQIQGTDSIIALGPLHQQNEPLFADAIVIAIYYLFIASALFLWLWPLSHDLHQLRKAAINFGEENFATRVKLRKNSSIAPVADAFNFMTQRIQELVVAHKDLTYAVSHELKTPLARFKFSLEILGTQNNAEQRHQYLQAMKQDVCELDDLIEEMLNYAKLSTDNLTLHLEKIDAERWLKNLIAQYNQKEIKIHIDCLPDQSNAKNEIVIDNHLMSRAVNNLIRNGLRYAKSQLKVSLTIANNAITLRVDDDGQGIHPKDFEQIFQPFTRLDASRDKQSGGYGLGLAITKKIIHQHGGEIIAYSSDFGGAGFQMYWPMIKTL